jgi:hypothetical protein
MTLLRQRARLTNLAVGLLLFVLSFSLLANLSHVLHPPTAPDPFKLEAWDDVASADQLRSRRPPSVETTIHRDARMDSVRHLVMVPGHAVWLGSDADLAVIDDDWVLEMMQRGGSVRTYVKHIRKAAEIVQSDPHALLVFSG